jgi:acetyl-CoA carboxylase biotin carboxyl carrier protein
MDDNKKQQIKQLIDFARNEGLKSFSYEDETLAVSFEFATASSTASSEGNLSKSTSNNKDDGNVIYIDSPLDGKFYRSPSPDSPPYVDNGSAVSDGDTVCIVEAMKVMNEITAECNAKIVQILCENGDDVRAGQHLFIISQP